MESFLLGRAMYYTSMMLSLLIICSFFPPKEHSTYARAKEHAGFLSLQGNNVEIYLIVLKNLSHPQVVAPFKTVQMFVHRVQTSLIICTPILFWFRAYLHIAVSRFSQSVVKLSI